MANVSILVVGRNVPTYYVPVATFFEIGNGDSIRLVLLAKL